MEKGKAGIVPTLAALTTMAVGVEVDGENRGTKHYLFIIIGTRNSSLIMKRKMFREKKKRKRGNITRSRNKYNQMRTAQQTKVQLQRNLEKATAADDKLNQN